jgi:hypothetical protein
MSSPWIAGNSIVGSFFFIAYLLHWHIDGLQHKTTMELPSPLILKEIRFHVKKLNTQDRINNMTKKASIHLVEIFTPKLQIYSTMGYSTS